MNEKTLAMLLYCKKEYGNEVVVKLCMAIHEANRKKEEEKICQAQGVLGVTNNMQVTLQ